MADDAKHVLKKIRPGAVQSALERAEHYRLLNDPGPAESICLDVLEIEPDNQRALVLLLLALTDQFTGAGQSSVKRAQATVNELTDDYQRLYYAGLVHERQARAWLERGMSAVFAYDSFRDAMQRYEQAEAVRPDGNDDCILRWNSCVRTIEQHGLGPLHDEGDLSMLE